LKKIQQKFKYWSLTKLSLVNMEIVVHNIFLSML
jgi:hypothetical protein